MELSKIELEQILTEVTKEYEEVVKSEKAKMEKSVLPVNKEETTSEESSEKSGEKSKPEAPKAQDPMPEGSDDKVVAKAEGDAPFPPKEDKPEEGGDEAPASEEAPTEPEAPVVEEQAPQEQEMVSDDEMGPDQLLQLYSGLSPEHLAAHWMAASQALFQSMQGEGGLPGEEAQVAPQVAPPQMDTAPEGVPEMAKSESAEFKALKKNFDELKTQNDLLEKNLDNLTDKLTAKLRLPASNGITSDNAISKSETEVARPLSKSEVLDLLKTKAKENKLTDSDKQKIYQFSVNPTVTEELKKFLGLK